MNRHNKIIAAIVVLGLIVSLGVAGYIIYAPPKDADPASAASLPNVENNIAVSNLDYVDGSGYRFSYPSGVSVADKTPEEGKYYSVLSLQKDSRVMTVSIEDTEFSSIGDWLVADDIDRNLVGAVSLDGISARQYESPSTLLTVAVDSGVLILIESPINEFWDSVHDLFVTSFVFDKTQPTEVAKKDDTPSSSSAPSTGNVIYEEEEIIQ